MQGGWNPGGDPGRARSDAPLGRVGAAPRAARARRARRAGRREPAPRGAGPATAHAVAAPALAAGPAAGRPTQAQVFYTVGRFVTHKNQLQRAARLSRGGERASERTPADGRSAGRSRLPRLHPTHVASAPAALRARIVLAGPQPIEAAHLAGDVLVHASSSEAWGRVIDEAFVLGNPTLVAALPMLAEKAGYTWRELPDGGGARRGRSAARPRFAYAPRDDAAEERSLLVDPSDVASIATALARAGTDARWRRQCHLYNRRVASELELEPARPASARDLESRGRARQRNAGLRRGARGAGYAPLAAADSARRASSSVSLNRRSTSSRSDGGRGV